MNPPVTIITDPDSGCSRDLHKLNNPAGGIVALHVRPNLRHLGWVVADMLDAMGRRPAASFGSDGWPTAAAYATAVLATGGIDTLVLGSAQALRLRHLDELAALADLTDTRLVLIADTSVTDDLADFGEGWGVASLPTKDARHLIRIFESRPHRRDNPSSPAPRGLPAPYPDVDVLLYLHVCRQVLGKAELREVENSFTRGFVTLNDSIRSKADRLTVEEAVDILRPLLGEARNRNEVVALTRGAQAASLRHGLLLRVDIDHFLRRSFLDDLHLHLEPGDWDLISQLCDPQTAAIATLAASGLNPQQMAQIAVDAVAPDGRSVKVNEDTMVVPDAGARLLLAHRIFAGLTVPADATQFVQAHRNTKPMAARAVSTALNAATRVTGIRFRVAHSDWDGRRNQSWRNRWGVNVRTLAP